MKARTGKPKSALPPVDPAVPASGEDALLMEQYVSMSEKEHVLEVPDTYIGSVKQVEASLWVVSETNDAMVQTPLTYIPGLLKLFDEAIVNCRDQSIRLGNDIRKHEAALKLDAALGPCVHKPVTKVRVDVDPKTGRISMENDGDGIDVALHPVQKCWIPELIFARFRTGKNFNKKEEKLTGGKNGLGAKLIFVWSTWGKVETVDHVRGLKYEQEFTQNLSVVGEPKITKVRAGTKPYTKIEFDPDYVRFGLPGLAPDMYALMKRRVYDIAGVTDKKVAVWFNGEPISVRTFPQYVGLYLQRPPPAVAEPESPEDRDTKKDTDKDSAKIVPAVAHEADPNGRWEYSVTLSPFREFRSVSLVNGINTYQGGKHVDHVLDQIVKKLIALIEKKRKIVVAPSAIREQLLLFVRADIVNPTFNSQSKERLDTPVKEFGSTCAVSDKFIAAIAAMGVVEMACNITSVKDNVRTGKIVNGSKSRNVSVDKLVDAVFAGTAKSRETDLMLCEGDSAKAGAMSGLSQTQRQYTGIYPCRGKLVNVRDDPLVAVSKLSDKQLKTYQEILNIIKAVGLEIGREYHTWDDVGKHLRYGRITLVADQDLDGSHIKGLINNVFSVMWPSLFRLPGFIRCLNTPIVVEVSSRKCEDPVSFYSTGEHAVWKERLPASERGHWTSKYFKGLGTSKKEDWIGYMSDPKYVNYLHLGKSSDDFMDRVFRKTRADDRKEWLLGVDASLFPDLTKPEVSYDEFLQIEMSQFSVASNVRAIPSAIDGLKPSLRKILYATLKKNVTGEIKVAALAGYVSGKTDYHHGEVSLCAAIIGMAQDFVGSNNINLLKPNGQFGTRLMGGKDSASPRYVFTGLQPIVASIFRPEDNCILRHELSDDRKPIEPTYYIPVIPLSTINESHGIGTGWSTDTVSCNPLQVVAYIRERIIARQRLAHDPDTDGHIRDPKFESAFFPWYDGYTGAVVRVPRGGKSASQFLVKGKYEIAADACTVTVTELPVGTWTEDYAKHLEKLVADKKIKAVAPPAFTDVTVHFTVTLNAPATDEMRTCCPTSMASPLEILLKLSSGVSTNNMWMHNSAGVLHKYASVEEIIYDHAAVRYSAYQRRKVAQLADMARQLVVLSNKARFVRETIDKTLVVAGLNAADARALLRSRGYDACSEDAAENKKGGGNTRDDDEDDDEAVDETKDKCKGSYEYLLSIRMSSMILENAQKNEGKYTDMKQSIRDLESTTEFQLWERDLDEFEAKYVEFREKRATTAAAAEQRKGTKSGKTKAKAKVVVKGTK